MLSQLAQEGRRRFHPFHLINAIAATVSQAEEAQLAALPQVLSVVPDAVVKGPALAPPVEQSQAVHLSQACSSKAELDPEALQLTNTASADPTVPQAQRLATGKGVTVAFLADGLDIHNPDFGAAGWVARVC